MTVEPPAPPDPPPPSDPRPAGQQPLGGDPTPRAQQGPAPADFEASKPPAHKASGVDMLMIVAGGLFVISTFLPWYRFRFGSVLTASRTAWGSGGFGVLAGLCGIAAVAIAVVVALGASELSAASAGLLEFGLSAAALFFSFLRLVFRLPGTTFAERISRGFLHVNRGIGLFLAVLLAIVMTIAGYRKYRENAV